MRTTILSLFFCIFTFHILAQDSIPSLKVGYTLAAPFIIENNGHLEGINMWLWNKVAEDLQLDYELVPMPFSAMLDSLRAGSIDVSINPLTITSQRSKEMEFTHSFYASHSTIVVGKQSSFQKLRQFVTSFFQVNFLRGFLVLLVILVFFGILAWLFERKANAMDFRPGYKGLFDGLWWSVVTLTTVGYGDKSPKTRMGKITALGLMFCGLLFVSGLTASIASSLTVDRLTNESTNFRDFKERSVGTISNSGAEDFLRVRFFKNVKTYDGVLPGLQSLDKGQIDAFIYDAPILQYRIQKDSSLQDLEVLPLKFDVQFYAFGIKKDAVELEQAISQRILEIVETQQWQVVLHEYSLTEF